VKCEKHDWDWDISDPTGCPVCYGERLERERIINLFGGKDEAEDDNTMIQVAFLIRCIREETMQYLLDDLDKNK
jgi:hypothetical protein